MKKIYNKPVIETYSAILGKMIAASIPVKEEDADPNIPTDAKRDIFNDFDDEED